MAELTRDQQRALALARARKRAADAASAQAQGRGHDVPEFDPGVPGYDPKTGEVTKPKTSMLASAAHGAADVGSFGFSDEMASLLASAFSDVPRDRILREMRGIQKKAYDDHPVAYIGGGLAAGIAQGAGLAGAGLSAGARAAQAGHGLVRTAAGSAVDGAVIGALNGAGAGEGTEDRVRKAMVGGGAGLAIGGAAPPITAGVAAAFKPIVAPVMARLRPEQYADDAIGQGLKRAGMKPDEVVAELEAAQAAGQDVYTVADAMGHSGQRMLSTAARNPNDNRQMIVEALERRQAGQGRRVVSALQEGFDAPDTAIQRRATLEAARDAEANVLYGAARQQAGAVDVSPVIAAIDETLSPGVNPLLRPRDRMANDSIEGALSRFRSMITDGKSNLTDFNAVFRAKLDLDDWIKRADAQGAGNRAHALARIQDALDETLARASAPYASARDAFAAGSRRMEAVDAGSMAAARGRPEDTIAAFRALPEDAQPGFRVGYADRHIEPITGAPVGVDKSRSLLSDATGKEFPAFAAPGRGRDMWDKLGREKRMFETRHKATRGSATADNLADSADMAQFDPAIATNLMRGRLVDAVIGAMTRGMNEAKGMPPSVLSQMADRLMTTNPEAARKMLMKGADKVSNTAGRRAIVSAILANIGAGGVARLVP